MKLSVIVPVYNAEKYLRRCADSILNQTYTDLELIMINDSSPDGSLAIMEEYAHRYPERVQIKTVPNHRQGAARNVGMELARGEYFGFVDSDDWIEPDMYQKLMEAALEADADVAICDIRSRFEETGETEVDGAYDNNRLAVGSACNKVFRRSAVGDIRFPADLWYEDFAFSARVLLSGASTVYVREALYDYRIGHVSTMHNSDASRNLDIVAILRLLEPHVTNRDDFEYLVINQVLIEAMNRVEASGADNRTAVLRQLRGYVRGVIPNLRRCKSFRSENRNRRIIMTMNYYGQTALSRLLLRAKAAL